MLLQFKEDLFINNELIAKKDKLYHIKNKHQDSLHYSFMDETDKETYVNPFNKNHKCKLIKEEK